MNEAQSTSSLPRVTFGMIVLNGEPFVRYNLRAIYPYAHQIIVVEGAAPAAAPIAGADGHSRDGTLHTLREFESREDPENKLIVVTAEDEGHPNGFWPGEKHEQSQAYAARATGDYLWQVDVDEFYHPADMQAVLEMLRDDPQITVVSFRQLVFWGGFDYVVDGWFLRRLHDIYRIFKWGEGYTYRTHRPPTVYDDQGRDLTSLKWVRGDDMARRGILKFHYSLVFPEQVREKTSYYSHADWAAYLWESEKWAREGYFELRRPFCVHNVYHSPSWLERFRGAHPSAIEKLRADIRDGKIQVDLRPTEDVEMLLASPWYRLGRFVLRAMAPWEEKARLLFRPLNHLVRGVWRGVRGGHRGMFTS